ncbi:hypothetical protein GE21DRAFT_3800 [Neurospora crassa]|uniref:CBM-cenC domain-containing protein n=1 Tax=Neurospora crassa (strain ATCC 24698 / 74-OR23-1A / CBS 708.71 / DSM 1257 / FGSC 987) TaxID=367110 RepID=Q7S1H3_NEUCR|nr:hypothetical protein NCU09498 [Neurospora crassa OR74A]EAA29191.2 hypothetical protein NCU09498 [Neurospora crassa OR74A]KHE81006.1 hypothetical protein GE21DRAFT_3800 [Neurospora crassa]|eukprot:XP_958427.2 hypothetical protein NCU09498 [Neurospora crassa OR74A]
MKFAGHHGVLPVLVGVAAASRCKPHPPSSSTLITTPTISSVPVSSVPVSSVPVSSVPVSSVLISSAPASSVLSSSSILSSSIPSSSLAATCGGAQCLAAITAVSSIGDAFCSSWLSWTPATTVVTEVETVTSTHTNLETVTAVVTLTTATVTETAGTTTLFQKRRQLPSADPAESIFSECDSASASVSSACSCHLAGSTTSTVTVTETTTSTEIPEYTGTLTTTETTNVIQTVSAEATRVVPAQPILNSGLESYLTTGNISPWTDTVSTTGGTLQIINGVNPCVSAGDCAGGQVVIRVYPPTIGGYTAIRQTFLARPNTSYNLSFMYRCLNYNNVAYMSVWYAGQLVPNGNVQCNTPGSAFARPRVGPFTTDETGVGEIEVRFHNPGGLLYLYMYADAFEATVAV